MTDVLVATYERVWACLAAAAITANLVNSTLVDRRQVQVAAFLHLRVVPWGGRRRHLLIVIIDVVVFALVVEVRVLVGTRSTAARHTLCLEGARLSALYASLVVLL